MINILLHHLTEKHPVAGLRGFSWDIEESSRSHHLWFLLRISISQRIFLSWIYSNLGSLWSSDKIFLKPKSLHFLFRSILIYHIWIINIVTFIFWFGDKWASFYVWLQALIEFFYSFFVLSVRITLREIAWGFILLNAFH